MSINQATPTHRMTRTEQRASASLAAVFALRMLGLFIILPIFSLEAAEYSGGNSAFLIGLALGVYGLTQAIFQLPMGWASDRWGRKPVIVLGLLLFAAGGLLAASTDNIYVLIAARAVQGAGTVSAAVTALLADLTRDTVRTKGMAIIGISIGATFALSLIIGAPLNGWIGLSGIFLLISVLAVLAIAVVVWITPNTQDTAATASPASEQPHAAHATQTHTAPTNSVLSLPLLRLYAGVFVLHAIQLAMWAYVPQLLLDAGIAKAAHWQVYLPALIGSLLIVGGFLFRLERKGYLRMVFLLSIALLLLALCGFVVLTTSATQSLLPPTPLVIGALLCIFFCGFNTLEASQPSLVSQYATANKRGSALGMYNTMQSLGLFTGGAVGGWLLQTYSATTLFICCCMGALLWLVLAWGMPTQKQMQRV